jgi:hypothetical protein
MPSTEPEEIENSFVAHLMRAHALVYFGLNFNGSVKSAGY